MKSLLLLFASLCVLGAQAPAAESKTRPNIIVILADDVGFSDIGCYGGEIATPNLDALARGGARFTQFYNTARCCPTRASLLTGLHPHQAGIGHMMEDRGLDGYRGTLNRHCVTIAEALRPGGYRNYAVGKWHVTPGQTAAKLTVTNNWPLQRGFDRFYGTIHGAGSYFDPSSLVRDNQLITMANDREYRPMEFYYTDAIADHAVKFIRQHAREAKDQPFFLYTAFTAAHWPLHAKEADLAKYKGRYDAGYEAVRAARLEKLKQVGLLDARWTPAPLPEKWADVKDQAFEARCMEVYAAQLDSMDQGIGRIVAELKAQGQFENTLILYLQDNGGCAEGVGRGTNFTARAAAPSLPSMAPDAPQFDSTPKQTRDGWPVRQGLGVMPGGPDTYLAYGRGWAGVSVTPFREYKHWTHEGGISTPLIVSWPAGMKDTGTRGRGDAEKGGRLVNEPGQLVDIMATCLEVSGAKYPSEFHGEKIKPLQGHSLVPLLSSAPFPPRLLHWEHEGNRAVRDGRWKLVAKENQPWELYDVAADRAESRNLATSEPARVQAMAAAWDEWAARSDVLPLGAWRAKENFSGAKRQTMFTLKVGDQLARAEAPAIAGRGFTITAKFDVKAGAEGVLVAQGGSSIGFALFVGQGKLHFTARSRGGVATANVPLTAGAHTAVARLDRSGALSIRLDRGAAVTASERVRISAMPADGLDVGSDTGGAAGPYSAPNTFTGTIESMTLELDPP